MDRLMGHYIFCKKPFTLNTDHLSRWKSDCYQQIWWKGHTASPKKKKNENKQDGLENPGHPQMASLYSYSEDVYPGGAFQYNKDSESARYYVLLINIA